MNFYCCKLIMFLSLIKAIIALERVWNLGFTLMSSNAGLSTSRTILSKVLEFISVILSYYILFLTLYFGFFHLFNHWILQFRQLRACILFHFNLYIYCSYSFMKPSEPRRNKNRNTTGPSTNGASSGHVTGRKRKSPSPAPAAVVPDSNNPDGPLPEFACKVCGRLVAVDLFSIHICTQFLLASSVSFWRKFYFQE